MVAWSLAARRSKISSFDPPLAAVPIPYPAKPLLPFFHPPIELASARPRSHFHLDWRLDFPAICLSILTRIKIFGGYAQLIEHSFDLR
jgi:hypothetical protein